jgi:hypothetical protein
MASSHCGDDTLSNLYYGLSAGFAARFGAAERFELGLLADFVAFPIIYCAGTEPAEVHRRDELSFDDPTLATTLRFAVHW